jgi:3-oxoacyl-[acyl-carrier protein] reductase
MSPPSAPWYCSAKAGLVHLTRSVATDYGRQGVRANAVLPGAIDTREIRRDAPTGEAMEERLHDLAQMSVLGRIGEPDEVADAIAFLLGDRSAFITGSALLVDGGWSLR